MKAAAVLTAVVALLVASSSSAQSTRWVWISWQVPEGVYDRFHVDENGIEIASFPGSWWGCADGCAIATGRVPVRLGTTLTMRSEHAGRFSPVGNAVASDVYLTSREAVNRRLLDVDGDCRSDGMDALIRELVNRGELE